MDAMTLSMSTVFRTALFSMFNLCQSYGPLVSSNCIFQISRAGVYEILCPKHMLAPKDNLETMLLYYTKCQSWKRQIIQSIIYRIMPKINQVSYTLDTICELNFMILA